MLVNKNNSVEEKGIYHPEKCLFVIVLRGLTTFELKHETIPVIWKAI